MQPSDSHFVELRGKRYVLYSGLLALAFERRIEGIEELIVQIPSDANGQTAVVKATVRGEGGKSFDGIGDANPKNVGKNIAPHILRMASTRAKARALRDFCNVGVTALEELSDGEESPRTSPQRIETPITEATPIRLSTSRQRRSRDDELTPGGVPIWKANELIELMAKAGHKKEEVAPYVWKASPEAFEKKWNEYHGKESKG